MLSKSLRGMPFLAFLLCFAGSVHATPLPQHKPSQGIEIPTTQDSETDYIRSEAKPIPRAKPLGKYTRLNEQDAILYRAIFKAQDEGDWDKADELTEKLSDLRLRSHILLQRLLHPTEWRSSYEELSGWLSQYPDHPSAHEVYKLATARQKNGDEAPQKPIQPKIISGMMVDLNPDPPAYSSKKSRSGVQSQAVKALQKDIERNLRQDRVTIAYAKLQQDTASTYMDETEYDALRARIAAGYLYVGKPSKAMELARASLMRSNKNVPLAGWVAGLTAWKQKDYESAYAFFQTPALSPRASTWSKAAGAFWASRSALKLGLYDKVSYWLNIAAQYNRTFYGILAINALGRDVSFNWDQPALSPEHISKIAKYPAGMRAILLTQAGQPHLASRELLRIHPGNDAALEEALIAYASANELPSFEIRFAHVFKHSDGSFYDASLYPIGSWEPRGGYKIDKAYIHAIVRQESRFNNRAENEASGALGLMQILPSTANYAMKTSTFTGKGRHALKDPITNVTAGQNYLLSLIQYNDIDKDLLSLSIAYNAGPGNLRKWQKKLSDIKDPLLFIEMIPYSETREYIEKVMSNYWIYRMRLGLDTPSLDAITSGTTARLPI